MRNVPMNDYGVDGQSFFNCSSASSSSARLDLCRQQLVFLSDSLPTSFDTLAAIVTVPAERIGHSNFPNMSAIRRIIPLLDRVLIEKAAAQKTSKGGVLLPESALSKLNEGRVVAVGPGARASDGSVIPPAVKEGDDVLLPEYGGSKIEVDGKEMYLYRDDDLLGVIEK